MILYYSDTFVLPLPTGHRFPMAKYRLVRERLTETEWGQQCELRLPPAATESQLLLAHSPDYVAKVFAGKLDRLEERRIGFPWSEQMVQRSLRSTGASIAAAEVACANSSVSVNMAGGTHHAAHDCGGGYCVFNDVCVASKVLQYRELVQNILILDLDVHQGNGTAEICAEDESIFTCSMHCDRNYPFLKATSDLDVALPEGVDDEAYLSALHATLATIERRFTPDFVFYLAGADPYQGDRLGKMRLTMHGLKRRDQIVFDWCHERRLPIAVSMAGGYANDVNDIVSIHLQTIEVAFRHWQRLLVQNLHD